MICEKCNKKLKYVRDVVGDPFMYCPTCSQVFAELNTEINYSTGWRKKTNG
jgi:uncharacterized C2H2 Zn-finger protein